MTNEELYERITSVLKEQCIGMNQLQLKIKDETGTRPKLHTTKSRLSLPHTVAFPYLTMFFNDDEMHELTLKKWIVQVLEERFWTYQMSYWLV